MGRSRRREESEKLGGAVNPLYKVYLSLDKSTKGWTAQRNTRFLTQPEAEARWSSWVGSKCLLVSLISTSFSPALGGTMEPAAYTQPHSVTSMASCLALSYRQSDFAGTD